ncbi:hypothetical protein [Rhodococcus opacus]|nr:hypothetical protein [Rhodococcus opacus]
MDLAIDNPPPPPRPAGSDGALTTAERVALLRSVHIDRLVHIETPSR